MAAAHISEWTGLYAGNLLTSIEEDLRWRSDRSTAAENLQEIVLLIKDYWDDIPGDFALLESSHRHEDTQCQSMITSIPWLAGFVDAEGSLDHAMEAIDSSPNDCTRLLTRFLVLLANHVIMARWKMEALIILEDNVVGSRPPLECPGADAVSRYIERYANLDWKTNDYMWPQLWNSLCAACDNCLLDKDLRLVSPRVAQFSLLAGCPTSTQDPFRNVEMLRTYLTARSFGSQAAELRREVEKLKMESQMQQRIIANLTFRHMLENLPPGTTDKTSSTARWADFFTKTLQNAQNQTRPDSELHPLHAVLRKYKDTTQIAAVGTGLYRALSTNIHQFSGQYTISKAQWNALEYDIMQALTPLPSNIALGEVDWQRERQRF